MILEGDKPGFLKQRVGALLSAAPGLNRGVVEERVAACLLTYLSCRMILFSFFQFSLKSVENSCQTVKKVLGETSFSPLLAFTEKNTQSSRNLRHKPSQTELSEITARLKGASFARCILLEIPQS